MYLFELLFPYPNLNPNPFPALQAPELTFPRLFQATHPNAFPQPMFYQKITPALLNYPVLPRANSLILPKGAGPCSWGT